MSDELDPRTLSRERRLLFVGSGLSNAMGMLSWAQLLETVAHDHLTDADRDRVLELIRSRREYDAADHLATAIGKDVLERRIITLIRDRQDKILSSPEKASWGSLIGRIAGSGIITTNWDTLLGKLTSCPVLSWPKDFETFMSSLARNVPFVLHLHGSIDKPPLAISRADCEQVKKTFLEKEHRLSTFLAIHNLVVLGSGFPDPHIEDELVVLAKKLSGHATRTRLIVIREAEAENFARLKPQIADKSFFVEYEHHSDFKEVLTRIAVIFNPSEALWRVAYLDRTDDLQQIVSAQPFTFATTSELRKHLVPNRTAPELLNFGAGFILDNRNLHDDRISCGIYATLLSLGDLNDQWKPKSAQLAALSKLCSRMIADGNAAFSNMIEPLAFALALKGVPAAQSGFIRAAVTEDLWRTAHVQHTTDYYGTYYAEIDAIQRHMSDPRRTGLKHANDVARLLNLVDVVEIDRLPQVISLLNTALETIHREGQDSLRRKVEEDRDTKLRNRKRVGIKIEKL